MCLTILWLVEQMKVPRAHTSLWLANRRCNRQVLLMMAMAATIFMSFLIETTRARAEGFKSALVTNTQSTSGQAGQIRVPPVANRNNLPGKTGNNIPGPKDVFGLTDTQRQAVEQECRGDVGKQFPKLQANPTVLNSICQCATNKIAQADAKLSQDDYARFLNKDPSLLNDPRYAQVIMDVSETCINPVFQKDPSVFLDFATPDGKMPSGGTYTFQGNDTTGAANAMPPGYYGALPGTTATQPQQPVPNNTRRPFVVR